MIHNLCHDIIKRLDDFITSLTCLETFIPNVLNLLASKIFLQTFVLSIFNVCMFSSYRHSYQFDIFPFVFSILDYSYLLRLKISTNFIDVVLQIFRTINFRICFL